TDTVFNGKNNAVDIHGRGGSGRQNKSRAATVFKWERYACKLCRVSIAVRMFFAENSVVSPAGKFKVMICPPGYV
ncbi:hypothetical protein Q2V48_27270, partial [Escherichia coli]|uniref:hypothetical protein n=2 Tax=Escherichia coli TaxID=562 RepID=UPI002666FEAB